MNAAVTPRRDPLTMRRSAASATHRFGRGRVPATTPSAFGPTSTNGPHTPLSYDGRRATLGWLLTFARFLAGVTRVNEAARWRTGWSVRHDWPDGTHILVGFRVKRTAAARARRMADAYWRTAPVRPRCSVVPVSFRDWELHGRRSDCRAPDCPSAERPPAEPVRVAR
jgi:hypothetical protein